MLKKILILTYILTILGFSAISKAGNEVLPIFVDHAGAKTERYVGQIAQSLDGEFFLVLENDRFFELMANIDLTEYNGKSVIIDGVEIKHRTGPVYSTFSTDPLQVEVPVAAPVLVVLGISEVAN